MYTIVLVKSFVGFKTLSDAYTVMAEWANSLRGVAVHMSGQQEGVVDSMKSLDSSVVGESLICSVVVNVKETGPIVEEPEILNE